MNKISSKHIIITCFIVLISIFIASCGTPTRIENNTNNQNYLHQTNNEVVNNSDGSKNITLTSIPSVEPTDMSTPTPKSTSTPSPSPSPIQVLPESAIWTDETHQYVWFGSYPQTQIKDDDLTEEIINASYDSVGNAFIDSIKYKRIREEDLPRVYYQEYDVDNLFHRNNSDYFDWMVNDYAYFIYEPIKWRVLCDEGDRLFLLADSSIDVQPYNASQDDISWNTCTLRSWLNGYDDLNNASGIDYSVPGTNFISTAFSEKECTYIIETENENIALFRPDEQNSIEKIFLLSSNDVVKTQYGFNESRSVWYEASGRVAYNTEYAMIMGGGLFERDGLFQSIWWLRSLSNPNEEDGISAVTISLNGEFGASIVSNPFYSVRPALYLQLQQSDELQR